MELSITSLIYLMIFIPLLSSLLCNIINFKNSSFYISSLSLIAVFGLIIIVFSNVLTYDILQNDYELSILGIGLEFFVDIVSSTILPIIIFLEFLVINFYKNDIKNTLNQRNQNYFYAVFLLKIFSLVGIFTANNLFNLYVFIEIYGFSYFAIATISRNRKLLNISFKSFCFSATSSILMLICFFVIYVTFGELKFSKIAENIFLLPSAKRWFSGMIISMFALSLILKFFPLWQYFEKIKSTSMVANFLVIDAFFVKVLVGIYLMIKFVYFFFGNDLIFTQLKFAPIFIMSGFLLSIYASYKAILARHLKLISVFFAISNLGFAISAIAIQTIDSLRGLFFILLNFSLINFFIFLFASFIKKNFFSSSVDKVKNIIKANNILALPVKLIVIFVAGLPFSFIFFAYWHLALATIGISMKVVMILAMLLANYSQIMVAMKIIDAMLVTDHDKIMRVQNKVVDSNKIQILILWLLIIVICTLGFMPEKINNLSLKFASFLLANTF